MKSKVYELVQPYTVKEVIKECQLRDNWVAVRPKLGCICHADLRYFTGSRSPEVLAKKLPMALIHEGIGEVVESKSDQFHIGDRVVIVPNIPARVLGREVEEGEVDQYSKNGKFMGSGYDGITQSLVVHPQECLVKIPDNVSDEIATLTEMSSIPVSAVRNIQDALKKKDTQIAIFGDGPLGYFTAAYIKSKYNLDADHLTVFGADAEKLHKFDFACVENVLTYDFSTPDKVYDIVFECTGGKFSESAINQAIQLSNTLGKIVLMGVSEQRVPINTRDVLEKGLTMYGSSRSITEDFETVIELLGNSEAYQTALEKLLPESTRIVKNADDFYDVMKYAANTPHWNKIIVEFEWN